MLMLSMGFVDHMSRVSRMIMQHCCAVLARREEASYCTWETHVLPTCSCHASLQRLGVVPAGNRSTAVQALCCRVHKALCWRVHI
jgi:hypothetical protein